MPCREDLPRSAPIGDEEEDEGNMSVFEVEIDSGTLTSNL